MKNKTPLILGGVFLALVALYFATSFRPKEVTQGATPVFKDGVPNIDKIEVVNPKGENVTLEKQNEVWNITSPFTYKADPEVIKQVMETLRDTLVDEIVSSSEDRQAHFGVVDSTAIGLKISGGGKVVLDALIGRFTPDLSHTYVRMRDSKDIALWRGVMSRIFNRNLDNWRDRTIFSFNPEDITSIKVSDGRVTNQLSVSDTTWVFTENGKEMPIDQTRAKQIVGLIATLTSDSFGSDEDIPRAGSTQPDTKVSFTVRNGDTHSFDLWSPRSEEDKGRYLVRTEKGDILFRFYELRGSNLKVSYDKLKAGA